MANYPCDPLPLPPPGTSIVEPGPLRAKRGYVVVGGDLPIACDDWAIANLEPDVEAAGFDSAITIIVDFLEHRGLTARIVVKIRAYNVDTLPLSIVVLRNSSDNRAGESWTFLTYILSSNMLRMLGGDEDLILPDGENPHPMPNVFHGFWHDLHAGNNDFIPNPAPIVVDVENGNIEVIQLPDTPDQNVDGANNANVVHDINLNELPIMDGVTEVPVENQAVEVVTSDNELANVRRSKRIAGETLGYKDVASAKAVEAAEADHTDDEAYVDLPPKYDATIVDNNAAPPPHLPLKTVQAIATGHCQMHPKDMSEEAMLYDSSNDSE
ncbi:hypothetical protein ACQ4PT_049434 [Festuca glaucescens]